MLVYQTTDFFHPFTVFLCEKRWIFQSIALHRRFVGLYSTSILIRTGIVSCSEAQGSTENLFTINTV
jgi:hypothetical protein